MRLGPLELNWRRTDLAKTTPLPPGVIGPEPVEIGRAITGVVGGSGTTIFAGIAQQNQEYLPELQSPQSYDLFDKMRFGDSQIAALLNVLKLPLISGQWTVEPCCGDPEHVAQSEFVETDLMAMRSTFNAWLRQCLLHLDYGSMLFEPIWRVEDGLVHLDDLAPRLPRTVVYWFADENGYFNGIRQGAIKATGYQLVDIPKEKLLLFVNDQEGSNFRGVSVLRSAYKHWYYKDNLYKVQAIALEKRGVGIDVGTLSGNVDVKRRRDAEQALMTLHAGAKNYLTEEKDANGNEFAYRVEGAGSARVMDPTAAIDHHNAMILRSVFADFLNMQQQGSRAMHQDKTSFFLMGLRAKSQNVEDTMNRDLIAPWCDYNWEIEAGHYPKLRHSRIDSRDVAMVSDAVNKLVQAGALTVDADLENEMRDLLDLPAKVAAEGEAPGGRGPVATQPGAGETQAKPKPIMGPKGGGQDTSGDTEGNGGGLSLGARQSIRLAGPRHPAEAHVDFQGLGVALDLGVTAVVEGLKEVHAKQIARLVNVGRSLLRKRDPAALGDVPVPYKADAAAAILDQTKALYDKGWASVARELKSQGATDLTAEAPAAAQREAWPLLTVRAQVTANTLADRLRTAFSQEVLRQIRQGTEDETALRAALDGLSDGALSTAAHNVVPEALNMGRRDMADDAKDQIRISVFSSVLDDHTCDPCAALDGQEFEMDSPEYEAVLPPYAECEGGEKCRCTMVFVYETEAQ